MIEVCIIFENYRYIEEYATEQDFYDKFSEIDICKFKQSKGVVVSGYMRWNPYVKCIYFVN